MDETERAFARRIREQGLIPAVIEYIKTNQRLPKPKLTLMQWWDVLGEFDRGGKYDRPGEPDTLIFGKMRQLMRVASRQGTMQRLAQTHEEWITVYVIAGEVEHNQVKAYARRRLIETCQTFEQWNGDTTDAEGLSMGFGPLEILGDEPHDPDLMQLALRRLRRCRFTLQQWGEIACGWVTDELHPFEEVALKKVGRMAKTRADWESLWKDHESCPADEELRSLIQQRLGMET